MDDDTDTTEIVICAKQQIFVYRIPPIRSNAAHRASDWNLSEPQWVGRMRILTKGKQCRILLEDSSTGALFAACPINSYPSPSILNVSDSSRYFVIKIVDENTGKHAFIGIGFAERSDSFDFSSSLQDFFAKDARIEQLKNEFKNQPKRDFTLKSGETIKLNMNVTNQPKVPNVDSSKISFKTTSINPSTRMKPTGSSQMCQVSLPSEVGAFSNKAVGSMSHTPSRGVSKQNDLIDLFGDDSASTTTTTASKTGDLNSIFSNNANTDPFDNTQFVNSNPFTQNINSYPNSNTTNQPAFDGFGFEVPSTAYYSFNQPQIQSNSPLNFPTLNLNSNAFNSNINTPAYTNPTPIQSNLQYFGGLNPVMNQSPIPGNFSDKPLSYGVQPGFVQNQNLNYNYGNQSSYNPATQNMASNTSNSGQNQNNDIFGDLFNSAKNK